MNTLKKAMFAAMLVLSALGLTVSRSAFSGQPPSLISITINPASAVLGVGQQGMGFYALGNYSNGTVRSLPTEKTYLTSTLLNDGKVLIAGGFDSYASPTTFDEADLYNPVTGTFSRTGAMTAMRDSHTATKLSDGKVLVAGGYADTPIIGTAELYNPTTENFRATGSMLESRAYHTATLLPDGKVLVTGGWTDAGAIATAELYNPATGTFNATGSMSTARDDHTATLLANGKVLIVGGGANVAELYDPATGTFTAAGMTVESRYGNTATLLPDGRVLITGGSWGSIFETEAELYDPMSGTFSVAGPMIDWRYWHTATLLANGKILVAGGGVNSAELYDPATNTFSATGLTLGARFDFAASLLNNGNVLVIGDTPPMAEIYDVTTNSWIDAGYNLGDPLVWSNSDSTIATSMEADGWSYLFGQLPGITTITATSGSLSKSAQVIVGIPPDVSITYPYYAFLGESVLLDGHATSNAPGGYIASYSWLQVAGYVGVPLSTYGAATTSFTAPYTEDWLGFQLTAVDNIGLSSSATAYINVATSTTTATTSSTSTTSTSTTTLVGDTTSTTVTSTTSTSSTTTTTVPNINNGCTTGGCDANYFCTGCHGVIVNGIQAAGSGGKVCAQRTVTEWTSTIDRMNAKGCGVSTSKITGIANYLASLGTGSTTSSTTTTSFEGTTTTTPVTTTTTSGGGTTTTVSPTTTTTLMGNSTSSTAATTTSTSTVTTSTTSTAVPTTVATTTTTTICKTFVNGTTDYPYGGIGSCHGHGDNGTGDHTVREEKWCQQHMSHTNNAGNHTHALTHPQCI